MNYQNRGLCYLPQPSASADNTDKQNIISLLTGRYELNKLTSLPMCGFIAQLVEHRTGIAEVTGSNPVEALIFFRLLLSSCLNWKIHCDDHSSLSSITAVQIYELFHIYLHHKHLHLDIYCSSCFIAYPLYPIASLKFCLQRFLIFFNI